MDATDQMLSEAESDAAELESLATNLARETTGLDDIAAELEAFSRRLDEEAKS